MNTIGIFGGTFDPIHYGHLRVALEVQQQLALKEIRFLPCQQPILKKHIAANSEQRLAMLQLAIADQPYFTLDNRELKRAGPSYTVDTLLSLRSEFGNEASLCFILGSDAFCNLPQWHHWTSLLQLANFIVISRPGYRFPTVGPVAKLTQQHKVSDPHLLHQLPHGCIFFPEITFLAISSTLIREQLANKSNPQYLLPDRVLDYIHQQQLYFKTNKL